MENRLARRQGSTSRDAAGPGGPRASGDADDNEDEKVYYGFGVFMGLPLADLKAMKEDFVEQQALANGRNGGARHALPPSAVMDGRAHRVEELADDETGYERITRQEDAQLMQQHGHLRASGYPRDDRQQPPPHHYDASSREGGPRGAQYGSGPPSGEGGDAGDGENPDSDDGSDGSYNGHKSHSLNFILH
ncbi:hypothetical protein BBJ28_00015745 [Nothophytophthora sp. Chile5]|nr:hypothetical protein BBJ28_00015745 [Nothophytophthora sp. Chile5]